MLDARPGLPAEPLARLQGGIIPFISESASKSEGWWLSLTNSERDRLVSNGLRQLFERYRLACGGVSPPAPVDEIALGFFASLTTALLEPLHRAFIAQPKIATELQHRAREAQLNPMDAQDCRYLVAQGIAEVLSAALFYRLLRDYFSGLDALLGGTTPSRANALATTVKHALDEAMRVSGDYQPILMLSAIAKWVLDEAPAHSVAHWTALIGFVDGLDVTSISEDILGSIFERLNSPERRREMGQHYTQPRLARCMAQWGVTAGDLKTLDPACGAGTFLVETYAREREAGQSHDEILDNTFGNDLDSFAVHLASINLATRQIRKGDNHPAVHHGDAFDLKPGASMLVVHPANGRPAVKTLATPDLVITNPPYGRSHPDEDYAMSRLLALMAPRGESPPAMKGANLAAWFVLLGHALGHAKSRQAFVLPSAVLQNDNLKAWRRWVRSRYDLTIWHTEHDIWFSDARVAPCVILFIPRPRAAGTTPGDVHFVNALERASGSIHNVSGSPAPCELAEVRDLSNLAAEEDLLIEGAKPSILRTFEQQKCVVTVEQLQSAEYEAGQKLGHAFFRLDELEPESPSVIRTVKGLGTTLKLNRKYLTPLLESPKQLGAGGTLQRTTWMLTLPEKLPQSKSVRDYIALGMANDVHKSPSVKARGTSWWSISAEAAGVAVAMNAQFQHQIAWLDPPAVAKNNFNVLRFDDPLAAELAAASLASAFGAMSLLYVSGEIGCEGARRVLLSQFVRWPVLDPRRVPADLAEQCVCAYREYRKFPSYEIDEMATDALHAWEQLTYAVAAAAALARSEESDQLAEDAIGECQSTVSRRRVREAMALGGRTRSRQTGDSTMGRLRAWCKASAGFQRCVELLVCGPEIVKLRGVAEIAALSLFGASSPFGDDHTREERLSDLLDEGFEAAPPDALTHSELLDELIRGLEDVAAEAAHAMIGDAPDEVSPVRATWNEQSGQLRTTLLRTLQADVRARLA